MMEVKRREPIAVVEYVLRRLERQAIDIGSHPVLIHEGLEALNRLREENARLRQRVEELERAPRCCADTIPPGCRTCRCADAAEARLAQAMKILRWLRNEAHALLSLEREGIIELVAITNVRALEAKIAEADAALAAAQPEEEK